MTFRKVVVTLAAIAIIVLAALAWIVLGPGPMAFAPGSTVAVGNGAADPTGVPRELASGDVIKRGEYLAHAADCLACHTGKNMAAYAGGFAFNLPMIGTIYSTNITPDKQTGIGNYTDAQFLAAVHRGKRQDGQNLYPAMPYASYTYMTDADALAIKARAPGE